MKEAAVALKALGEMTAEYVFLKVHSGGCVGRGSAGSRETSEDVSGSPGEPGLGGGGWRWRRGPAAVGEEFQRRLFGLSREMGGDSIS